MVKIISNEQTIIFEGSNFELITNVHNQNDFPEYEKVIPQNNNHVIIVSRADLTAAMNRVVLIGEKSIKIEFSINNEWVRLITKNDRNEAAYEDVTLEKGAERKNVVYNSAFLLDLLNSIDCEKIKIKIKDEMSGTLIEKVGADDFKYIVMPIRGN